MNRGSSETTGPGTPYLSSSEVVEQLGISKSTLYAYVSRGLIRSEPVPDAPRTRRYRADDVERLLNRQRIRTDPEQASTGALAWGSPVLESGISVIADERLYYRGQDATSLAREHSFEQTIALLWLSDSQAKLPRPDEQAAGIRRQTMQASQSLMPSIDTPARVQMVLPVLEQLEPASFDFRTETLHRVGMDILQTFVGALVGAEAHAGLARTLQAYWAPGKTDFARLIDAALVLSADHELNASTFTVRCIASARAPLHSAVAGGISAIRGQKHGGATLQAEALVREVQSGGKAYDVLRQRLQRGEELAGFGHRLYPSGDPRGTMLLQLLEDQLSDSPEVNLALEISAAAEELQGVKPNLEFALVTLCSVLDLPPGSPLSIMALGRTAGWVAHAVEEYERNSLIRPRARYSGTPPES